MKLGAGRYDPSTLVHRKGDLMPDKQGDKDKGAKKDQGSKGGSQKKEQ